MALTKTVSFKQETIYDESNTDKLYTKINLVVQGVMNYCIDGNNPPVTIAHIREQMLTPRQHLIYTLNSQTMVNSPFNGAIRDENNGPKPIRFDVIQLGGGSTLIVEFEVETWINECSAGQNANQVLSNRWEMKHAIGKDYLSSRMISGTLVMSGFMNNNANYSPDNYRHLIFPDIPGGWKRDVVDVSVSADNLKLTYQVVDNELHIAMPRPIVDIDMSYRQNWGKGAAFITGDDVGVTNNDYSVRVKGEPGAKMQDMLQVATQCLFS